MNPLRSAARAAIRGICVAGLLLLTTLAYNSARIVSIYVFVIGIVFIFAPVVLLREGFVVTVGVRYILYSLSGLFLASIVSDEENMTWFCYGMIGGLAASAGVLSEPQCERLRAAGLDLREAGPAPALQILRSA